MIKSAHININASIYIKMLISVDKPDRNNKFVKKNTGNKALVKKIGPSL